MSETVLCGLIASAQRSYSRLAGEAEAFPKLLNNPFPLSSHESDSHKYWNNQFMKFNFNLILQVTKRSDMKCTQSSPGSSSYVGFSVEQYDDADVH
jgi:hypothetical protein